MTAGEGISPIRLEIIAARIAADAPGAFLFAWSFASHQARQVHVRKTTQQTGPDANPAGILCYSLAYRPTRAGRHATSGEGGKMSTKRTILLAAGKEEGGRCPVVTDRPVIWRRERSPSRPPC